MIVGSLSTHLINSMISDPMSPNWDSSGRLIGSRNASLRNSSAILNRPTVFIAIVNINEKATNVYFRNTRRSIRGFFEINTEHTCRLTIKF